MARVIIHDQQVGQGSKTKQQHTWPNCWTSVGETFFCFTCNTQEEIIYHGKSSFSKWVEYFYLNIKTKEVGFYVYNVYNAKLLSLLGISAWNQNLEVNYCVIILIAHNIIVQDELAGIYVKFKSKLNQI